MCTGVPGRWRPQHHLPGVQEKLQGPRGASWARRKVPSVAKRLCGRERKPPEEPRRPVALLMARQRPTRAGKGRYDPLEESQHRSQPLPTRDDGADKQRCPKLRHEMASEGRDHLHVCGTHATRARWARPKRSVPHRHRLGQWPLPGILWDVRHSWTAGSPKPSWSTACGPTRGNDSVVWYIPNESDRPWNTPDHHWAPCGQGNLAFSA